MHEIVVLGEGRVERIELDPKVAEEVEMLAVEEQDQPPVVLRFWDPERSYYLSIYDHREASRKAFLNNGDLLKVFHKAPCLVGFRKKGKTSYCVITDLGTPDMRDGGEDERLVLTRTGAFDKRRYRVIGQNQPAIHPATGICLVEPRPAES